MCGFLSNLLNKFRTDPTSNRNDYHVADNTYNHQIMRPIHKIKNTYKQSSKDTGYKNGVYHVLDRSWKEYFSGIPNAQMSQNFAIVAGPITLGSYYVHDLIFDTSLYHIEDIVCGDDFCVFLTQDGRCYICSIITAEKTSTSTKIIKWCESWNIEQTKMDGECAVLIPLDDCIEKVFAHTFLALLTTEGHVHFYTNTVCYKWDESKFEGEKVVTMSMGNDFSLFLTEGYKLFGFGTNGAYQMGVSSLFYDFQFVKIDISHIIERPMQLYSTYNTSFILTEGGDVYSTGEGSYGSNGHGQVTLKKFTKIPDLPCKVLDISEGLFFCFLKMENGKFLVFGLNNFSQLSRSATIKDGTVFSPTELDSFPNNEIKTITCGGYKSGLVTHDNRIFVVGGTQTGSLSPYNLDSFNLIDLKLLLNVSVGSLYDLKLSLGRYFSVVWTKSNQAQISYLFTFRKSFKISDILIVTRATGNDCVGSESKFEDIIMSND